MVLEFRREVGGIGNACKIDRDDEAFIRGLLGAGAVDENDIIGTRIGAQLGQHFRFGAEIVMHDFNAGLGLELFERPFFVGAVTLPVEHGDLGCRTGIAGAK